MLEMTAVRSTTGNYYGALRDDASDGTAETDIPDPDPEALLRGDLGVREFVWNQRGFFLQNKAKCLY